MGVAITEARLGKTTKEDMMDIVIISTSINEAPKAYAEWAKVGRLIIAGDMNTPSTLQDFIKDLGPQHTYLHPQKQMRWESSEVIGWGSIQRRNIAILESIRTGAEIVITVDDDNMPLEDIHHIIDTFKSDDRVPFIKTKTGWYDPCQHLTPPIWHRGFPYSQRQEQHNPGFSIVKTPNLPIGVVAATWLGEPDVGAIDRIANSKQVIGCRDFLHNGIALYPGTWAPFNSQATAWDAKYASLMMCWPGVGRFDDILASFLARRVLDELGVGVKYTRPLVRQNRNEHDAFADLEKEIFGYRRQDTICDLLRGVDLSDVTDMDMMQDRVYNTLASARVLPEQTVQSFSAWMNDVKTAETERGV